MLGFLAAGAEVCGHPFLDHPVHFGDGAHLQPFGAFTRDVGADPLLGTQINGFLGGADRAIQPVAHIVQPHRQFAGIAECRAAGAALLAGEAIAQALQALGIAFQLDELALGHGDGPNGLEMLDPADSGDSGTAIG
jgi:hypothetical protein